jgi:environmental stress-induced protein Ves
MQVLPAATRQWVPWRNGGGTTSEVATGPDAAGADDFGWRVSIARIDRDGPFSPFPGMDRTLLVLAGGSLALTQAGREIILHPESDSFSFDGGQPVDAQVASAAIVLNLMVRRGSSDHVPETLVLALRPMTLGDASLSAFDAVRFGPNEAVPPVEPGDAIRVCPDRSLMSRR